MWAMMPMLRVRARGYSRIASPLPSFTFCSVVATCILSAGTAITDPLHMGNRPLGAGPVFLVDHHR